MDPYSPFAYCSKFWSFISLSNFWKRKKYTLWFPVCLKLTLTHANISLKILLDVKFHCTDNFFGNFEDITLLLSSPITYICNHWNSALKEQFPISHSSAPSSYHSTFIMNWRILHSLYKQNYIKWSLYDWLMPFNIISTRSTQVI